MNQRRTPRILIVRPLGRGGRGGIDRVVDAELSVISENDAKVSECVTRGPGSKILSPFYFLRALAITVTLGLTCRIDIVHIHLSSHGSFTRKKLIMAVCQAMGVPYIIHLHGSRFRQYWEALPTHQALKVDRAFASAARVIVLGDVWRDLVLSRVPTAKVEILFNGTPTPTRSRGEHTIGSPVQILFLGVVGKRKGTLELVAALANLKTKGIDCWQAVIAGNGDVDACYRDVKARGLDGKVNILGWIETEQVSELLNSSDILALPSHDENLPMSVIEGMANGLAVVTTPVGATASIIHDNETGILVPVGDVNSLSEALALLVSDAATRARLGNAAQAFHRDQLEINIHVGSLVQIWRSIVSDTPM